MPTKTKKTPVMEPTVEMTEAVEIIEKTEEKVKKAPKTVVQQVEEAMGENSKRARKLLKVRVPKPVRTAYLAGLGAMSMAQDETEHFIDKLVEQGTQAEKEGRRWITRVVKQQRKQTEKAADKVEERVEEYTDRFEAQVEKVLNRLNIPTRERIEQTVETALAKLNVPTKGDIDRLSSKITELTMKVDELKVGANGHKVEA